MTGWKDLRVDGIVSIDRVVGEYYVYCHMKMPYGKFRVRVLEGRTGFIGVPDFGIRNHGDGTVDNTTGSGNSAVEALEKCIRNVLELIGEHEEANGRPLEEGDIDWADPRDF